MMTFVTMDKEQDTAQVKFEKIGAKEWQTLYYWLDAVDGRAVNIVSEKHKSHKAAERAYYATIGTLAVAGYTITAKGGN